MELSALVRHTLPETAYASTSAGLRTNSVPEVQAMRIHLCLKPHISVNVRHSVRRCVVLPLSQSHESGRPFLLVRGFHVSKYH
jgi:hypothetical protein